MPGSEFRSLKSLRDAASDCQACPLYRDATQTVFGEGTPRARLVFVGEQPGDSEDRLGHPFVGPAGRELDDGLAAAGIDRTDVYITNVVKHFKFTRRGKRRIHKKPNAEEIRACHPWLERELELIKPVGIVCLGATAAQALMGRTTTITKARGAFHPTDHARWITATIHPSAILRAPDDAREQQRDAFVKDLRAIAKAVQNEPRTKRAG